MQALDPTAAGLVTGDWHDPAEHPGGKTAPETEFGRFMDQALVPAGNQDRQPSPLRPKKSPQAAPPAADSPGNSRRPTAVAPTTSPAADAITQRAGPKDQVKPLADGKKDTGAAQTSPPPPATEIIPAPTPPLPAGILAAQNIPSGFFSPDTAWSSSPSPEPLAGSSGQNRATTIMPGLPVKTETGGQVPTGPAKSKTKTDLTKAALLAAAGQESNVTEAVPGATATKTAPIAPTAVEAPMEIPPGVPAEAPEPPRTSPAAKPKPLTVETGGMGPATSALSMKKTGNTNKTAGLDVKDLPVDLAFTSLEKNLPSQAATPFTRPSETQLADVNSDPTPLAPATAASTATTTGMELLPNMTDMRLRNVERTHDMVALHALRLVNSQSDTLQVVIRPGAGTELSLELRHRNGGVEAEAILQHGDFKWMNQHWPDLQQRLEHRGIKLAPLGGQENTTADGGGNFQQAPSSRDDEAQQASAFAEFALAGRSGGASARLAPALGHDGWESWA